MIKDVVFVGSDIRKVLREMLRRKPVLAAVAYISDVGDLPLSKGDILVCDASNKAARAGSTRRGAIAELLERGVHVWSLPDLHAKVVVAGDRVVVGSANWSARSSAVLTEAAVILSDAATMRDATRFVKGLARPPAERVNKTFLRKMPEPEIVPSPTRVERRRSAEEASQNWLLALAAGRVRGAAAEMQDTLDGEVDDFVARGASPLDFYTFTWAGQRGPGTSLRVMDRAIIIHTDEEGRTRVMPPGTIIRAEEERGVLGAILLRPPSGARRSVPLQRFARWCAEVGITKIGARTGRRLLPEQFATLEDRWAGRSAAPPPQR